MRHILFSAVMIVAFTLGTAAAASAAPARLQSSDQTLDQRMKKDTRAWIGKSTSDLLIQRGVPDFAVLKPNGGQTIEYIRHMYLGRGNPIEMVQRFDVNENGKITSGDAYQM